MKRAYAVSDCNMDSKTDEPSAYFTTSTTFDLYQQGAEARLYKGTYLGRSALIKERFPKTYRHPDLDSRLKAERMRSELRCLKRCKQIGIETPSIYFVDGVANRIYMSFIDDSITVRQYFHETRLISKEPEHFAKIATPVCISMGLIFAKMHINDVIHGDLTTSNVLIRQNSTNDDNFKVDPVSDKNATSASASNNGKDDSQNEKRLKSDLINDTTNKIELILIDFGLSYVGRSAEDKAVDLFVLEKAFISTHPNSEAMFQTVLESYGQAYSNKKALAAVLKKLDEVRTRGRKRLMVG